MLMLISTEGNLYWFSSLNPNSVEANFSSWDRSVEVNLCWRQSLLLFSSEVNFCGGKYLLRQTSIEIILCWVHLLLRPIYWVYLCWVQSLLMPISDANLCGGRPVSRVMSFVLRLNFIESLSLRPVCFGRSLLREISLVAYFWDQSLLMLVSVEANLRGGLSLLRPTPVNSNLSWVRTFLRPSSANANQFYFKSLSMPIFI
jgi:hypothetical protein